MNQPPYILTDLLETATLNTKNAINAFRAALDPALPPIELNYQYGKVQEINEMLKEYSETPQFSMLKFPLIWVNVGYNWVRGNKGVFGTTTGLRIFIITDSEQADTTVDRITKTFKPTIYPLYAEFLKQLAKLKVNGIKVFTDLVPEEITHTFKDYYFFSENGTQSVLVDVVDAAEIGNLKLTLKNNNNCPKTGVTY